MTLQISEEETCEDPVRYTEYRERRKGQLRTDMHTFYDIPFQVLDEVPAQELRKIKENMGGEYSGQLRREAERILRERTKVEPQDRDAIEADM